MAVLKLHIQEEDWGIEGWEKGGGKQHHHHASEPQFTHTNVSHVSHFADIRGFM